MFDWNKTIHLIRGLPGEGKSTLASQLTKDRGQIVENDDFFFYSRYSHIINKAIGPFAWWWTDDYKKHWKYKYHKKMKPLVQQWCVSEAFRRLLSYDEVFVTSSFVLRNQITPYLEQALIYQVKVILHRPTTEWVGDLKECKKRNTHNISLERLKEMKNQWEDMSQQEVDDFLFTKP